MSVPIRPALVACIWVARIRPNGSENRSRRTATRLEGHQWGTASPGPYVRGKSYPNGAQQSTSQWFFGKPFQNRMMKPLSEDAMTVWPPKRSDTSSTLIFSRCRFRLIAEGTSRCTLWPGYPFPLTKRAMVTTPLQVIANRLTKTFHYEMVQVTLNAPRLVEVILDMVARHRDR